MVVICLSAALRDISDIRGILVREPPDISDIRIVISVSRVSRPSDTSSDNITLQQPYHLTDHEFALHSQQRLLHHLTVAPAAQHKHLSV